MASKSTAVYDDIGYYEKSGIVGGTLQKLHSTPEGF